MNKENGGYSVCDVKTINLRLWSLFRGTAHEQQLHAHIQREALHWADVNLVLIIKVTRKQPEKLDIMTGVKPDLKKSKQDQRGGVRGRLPLKWAQCVHTERWMHLPACCHWLHIMHSTDTQSCDTLSQIPQRVCNSVKPDRICAQEWVSAWTWPSFLLVD